MSGIDNKVRYSRASEIKAPFNLNKKLVAFTLAEVLITLAIIGVVAALTIPTVVAKYQKKQYYTQFMKSFNTFINAKNLAEAENGTMDTWGLVEDHEHAKEIFEKNFYPYLKIQKVCETNEECGITDNLTYDLLNMVIDDPQYATNYYKDAFYTDENHLLVMLNDGSLFQIGLSHFDDFSSSDLSVMLDINGIKKPNIWGRDIFGFGFSYGAGRKVQGVLDQGSLEDAIGECSTEEETNGNTCSLRLLLEGKMNY